MTGVEVKQKEEFVGWIKTSLFLVDAFYWVQS